MSDERIVAIFNFSNVSCLTPLSCLTNPLLPRGGYIQCNIETIDLNLVFLFWSNVFTFGLGFFQANDDMSITYLFSFDINEDLSTSPTDTYSWLTVPRDAFC